MKADDITAVESESGVIASLIRNPELFFYSEHLLPNHFYDEENRYLYAAIAGLAKKGITNVDAYNIVESLNSDDATRGYPSGLTVDKIQDIIDMTDCIARRTPEEYKLLVGNVLDAAFRRDTFSRLKRCQDLCYNRSVRDIEQKIYRELDEVMMEFSTTNDIPEYKDVVDDCWAEIQERQGAGYAGYPFKFPTLNEYATIERGELFIFGAEQKQGKSMMLLNCAVDLLKQDLSVLYIDSELNTRMFTARLLAHLSGVAYKCLTSGRYTPEEEQRIIEAKEWMKTRKFTHIYIPMFDQQSIYTAVKKTYHTQGIDVLIVDRKMVHVKPVELLEHPESRINHSVHMKQGEARWFENDPDWAISSQAPNRRRFNDYPIWEYTASDWRWKWQASARDEDIVCSSRKREGQSDRA